MTEREKDYRSEVAPGVILGALAVSLDLSWFSFDEFNGYSSDSSVLLPMEPFHPAWNEAWGPSDEYFQSKWQRVSRC